MYPIFKFAHSNKNSEYDEDGKIDFTVTIMNICRQPNDSYEEK
jgi:hypothetical protein